MSRLLQTAVVGALTFGFSRGASLFPGENGVILSGTKVTLPDAMARAVAVWPPPTENTNVAAVERGGASARSRRVASDDWRADKDPPYEINDVSIFYAVEDWIADPSGVGVIKDWTEIESWDVSRVTNMENLFSGKVSFDADLNKWKTGQVTTMKSAFALCKDFSGDDGLDWDTGNVVDMSFMFSATENFDADLNHWDTSSVTNMDAMFYMSTFWGGADLNNWNTAKVTSFSTMFASTTSFDGKIQDWDTGSATSLNGMFKKAKAFRGYKFDLNAWQTSNVQHMSDTFSCPDTSCVFNGPIGKWDTSKVEKTTNLFLGASNFDQDINTWDVRRVKDMSSTFESATSFNQDLGLWEPNSALTMQNIFLKAITFKQNIDCWDMEQRFPRVVTRHAFRNSGLDKENNPPCWYAKEDCHCETTATTTGTTTGTSTPTNTATTATSTATSTPTTPTTPSTSFLASKTALQSEVVAGATEVQVPQAFQNLLSAGGQITFSPGSDIAETKRVVGFGSIIFAPPLQNTHPAGATLVVADPGPVLEASSADDASQTASVSSPVVLAMVITFTLVLVVGLGYIFVVHYKNKKNGVVMRHGSRVSVVAPLEQRMSREREDKRKKSHFDVSTMRSSSAVRTDDTDGDDSDTLATWREQNDLRGEASSAPTSTWSGSAAKKQSASSAYPEDAGPAHSKPLGTMVELAHYSAQPVLPAALPMHSSTA